MRFITFMRIQYKTVNFFFRFNQILALYSPSPNQTNCILQYEDLVEVFLFHSCHIIHDKV